MSDKTMPPKKYWRSVAEARSRLKVLDSHGPEFKPGDEELVIEGGASRRKFMGLIGAGVALAGTTGGCLRKPVEHILPFAERPEDLVPGEPDYYATAVQFGGTVMGLLVKSLDGRPIKIEGNPGHSGSRGSTDVWAQGSLLGLYDPERSRRPMSRVAAAYADAADEATARTNAGETLCRSARARAEEATRSVDRGAQVEADCRAKLDGGTWTIAAQGDQTRATVMIENDEQAPVDWNTVWPNFDAAMVAKQGAQGQGLALVVDGRQSPTFRGLLSLFRRNYPSARIFLDDPAYPVHSIAAAEMVCGEGGRCFYTLGGAKVILAADADFLGTEQDHVRLSREFAANRKVEGPTDEMSRLYVVEPHLTVTGGAADNRLRLRSGYVGGFLAAVATELGKKLGVAPGAESLAKAIAAQAATFTQPSAERFVAAVVDDLLAHDKGDAVVIVGERQPPAVHGIGFYINRLINAYNANAIGSLVFRYDSDAVKTEDLAALAAGLDDGSIDTVVCLETNPAYDAPGTLAMRDKLAKAKLIVHAGLYNDETGQLAKWHLPVSHFLESWGDLEAMDFTVAIVQPLIAPLHDTPSSLELLARIVHPEQPTDGYTTVKGYWQQEASVSDRTWRQWLHQGRAEGVPRSPMRPATTEWSAVGDAVVALTVPEGDFEIDFHLCPKLIAGQFSNNAWMQELAHPITKMAWDNAACISAETAAKLGVTNGTFVDLKLGDRGLSVPVWISPGQEHDTVSVTLGYGRRGLGSVAEGAGFDVNPLRSHERPFFDAGKVTAGSGTYQLVSTQDYGSLDPDGPDGRTLLGNKINFDRRPIYREISLADYRKELEEMAPDAKRAPFARRGDLVPEERLQSLWDHPPFAGPQQWGKSIDLNLCTACNACVIACQAENNIPVVGKSEVANGREMAWIRIDRYYVGDLDDPQAVVMPIACAHCETAPCENVCPVQATAHGPEGLNDMAYNRCVGTRYCANNCPFKVRRFNFYNYNREIDPLAQLGKNPDVTIRFRGVIEKCSYCVQRINRAKSAAHVAGLDKVADGTFEVACEQACPTKAIVFGDITPAYVGGDEPAAEGEAGAGHGETKKERALLPPEQQTRVFNSKRSKRDYGVLADLNLHARTTFLGRVRNPNPKLS